MGRKKKVYSDDFKRKMVMEYEDGDISASLLEDLSKYWNRRIDDSNRLVYKIDKGIIKIVQYCSYYGDK